MAETKHVHHSANKTGRGIVFPGRYPQVAEQLENLRKHCKSKRFPADGGGKESDEGKRGK